MSAEPRLFLWFDRDPFVFDADMTVADVPGTADIDLVTAAILEGRLGKILPARIQMSTHERPESSRSIRSIDVGRLLRDLGIQHRRCYEIEFPE